MFAFSFSPILFFWMMHGTMLGIGSRDSEGSIWKQASKQRELKKGTMDTSSKEWMQKHLFLSSHTDHKGWQVYMKRLKNIKFGQKWGNSLWGGNWCSIPKGFQIIAMFFYCSKFFWNFPILSSGDDDHHFNQYTGEFPFLLITSIAHEASVFPICIIIKIFASNFIPCHNYCEICV